MDLSSVLSLVLPGSVFVALVGALVGVLRYQNKQITDGKLIPVTTHQTIVQSAVDRGNEWRDAALLAQGANSTKDEQIKVLSSQLSTSIESNEITKHFFETYLPRRTPQALPSPEEGTS